MVNVGMKGVWRTILHSAKLNYWVMLEKLI